MAEEKARDPTKPEIKPVNIPLSKIHDLPGSVFAPPSQKSLEALTSSIVLKGVQEPVILRQREDGEFQIVSGNRRRKASELAKQTEILAFVYDMTEKEAKDFRFRSKGEGTPPGKLLPESEIGKKRDAPEKASDKAANAKISDVPLKSPEKPAEVKTAPAPEPKKSKEKPKTVPLAEKADTAGKKTDAAPKSPEKPTEAKPMPALEPKKPEEKPKATPSPDKADTTDKKPDVAPQQPEKPAAVKPAPAFMPGPAALGPSGTKITRIFDERLMPPDEQAMKDLPVPKDGESYFITLHPAYLEKSEFNTVSVDVTSDDYKELKKSIELNGVKDPVLTRINPKGGLEILSGQRRHMIAREFNYPVPAIIQKIDDNDAMILVADSNLHRPHISTYDLSRTLRNKMTAMKRKAGRKKRGAPGADELNSDETLAKEMGISTSKLNRIIRLSEASKAVCDAVDDNSLELSIASALSFLKPEHQNAVIDLMGINLKPTVKRVQRLRDAEKGGKLDDKTMRDILEDKDLQPVKPPEPPKSALTQSAPPFPVASMVTPNASPTPAVGAPQVTPKQISLGMKSIMSEPSKQESTPQPPAAQTAEKPETAPEPAVNVIPISTESKQPGESKADEEPIAHNSQRDSMYSTKVVLGGDRLRKYFPDVSMTPDEIVDSIYSALEERRQREARMKQKTEILHPGKPSPTR